jgi:hypothetical protein
MQKSESRHPVVAPKVSLPEAARSLFQDDGDDEFGNDFDGDVDLDAIEFAATQAVRDQPPSSSNVCRNHHPRLAIAE